VVYTNTYVHIVGDANSNETSSHYAWLYFFSDDGVTLSVGTHDKEVPLFIKLLGGYGTDGDSQAFQEYYITVLTADSVTATALLDSGAFYRKCLYREVSRHCKFFKHHRGGTGSGHQFKHYGAVKHHGLAERHHSDRHYHLSGL